MGGTHLLESRVLLGPLSSRRLGCSMLGITLYIGDTLTVFSKGDTLRLDRCPREKQRTLQQEILQIQGD